MFSITTAHILDVLYFTLVFKIEQNYPPTRLNLMLEMLMYFENMFSMANTRITAGTLLVPIFFATLQLNVELPFSTNHKYGIVFFHMCVSFKLFICH